MKHLLPLLALVLMGCAKEDPAPPAPTGDTPIGTPILLAPFNGAQNLTTPIPFHWTKVQGATSYTVRCLILENAPTGWLWMNTTDTTLTYNGPVWSNAQGKEVTWDVGVNTAAGQGSGPWSESSTFTLAP